MWQCLETISVVITGWGAVLLASSSELRDAAKHLTTHRTVHHPKKELSAPNVTSAEFEKSWCRKWRSTLEFKGHWTGSQEPKDSAPGAWPWESHFPSSGLRRWDGGTNSQIDLRFPLGEFSFMCLLSIYLNALSHFFSPLIIVASGFHVSFSFLYFVLGNIFIFRR